MTEDELDIPEDAGVLDVLINVVRNEATGKLMKERYAILKSGTKVIFSLEEIE